MNIGTKIRTALFIITIINQANVSLGVWEFGNETVNLVYKIFSYLLTLAAGSAALWFNNDFTPIAAEYTGAMRQAKAQAEQNGIPLEEIEDLDPLEDGDDE